MTTQAQIDAVHALSINGQHDQAALSYEQSWPDLWLASLADLLARTERVQKVALAATDGAAGMLSWQNPTGQPILARIVLDITTPATGAHTSNFGQAATAASSDDLIDGVDTGTAAGVFSSFDDQGTNGRTYRRVAVDEYVTGSTATGAASGLVGNAFLYYTIIG